MNYIKTSNLAVLIYSLIIADQLAQFAYRHYESVVWAAIYTLLALITLILIFKDIINSKKTNEKKWLLYFLLCFIILSVIFQWTDFCKVVL